MSDFFRNLITEIKDEDTVIAADGTGSAEFGGFIDTGSYSLNAILSGSLYGGVPDNKVTAFAGESATGKTYFVLGVVRSFLQKNPTGGVVYYDTEAAVTRGMMEERGIDTNRVIIAEPDTIQKFRTHALKMLDAYSKQPEDKRPPMLFVLDSLGLLSTSKEMEDSTEGKDTRDMTKAQIIKAAFRVLTLKLAKVKVPMLVTNHVYDLVGSYVPTKELGGGTGLKYAASTIAMLTKKKEKDATGEVVGNIIKIKMYKSRLSKEQKTAEVLLTFDKGLDRYYGLLDLAEKYNIIKKVSTRYELPNGSKVFGKEINNNPTKYFTEDVMQRLEEAAKQEYSYGGKGLVSSDTEEEHVNVERESQEAV
jgi:RecA/RadA recombinase